jgi:hypothetical protein
MGPIERASLKEHKHNLRQGLLEKSRLAQHAYEEGHKICWNEARVLQIEPNIIYRKYKESAHMSLLINPISQPSLDISPIWTPVISEEVGKLLHSWSLCDMTGLQKRVYLNGPPPFFLHHSHRSCWSGFCLSYYISSYLLLVPHFYCPVWWNFIYSWTRSESPALIYFV